MKRRNILILGGLAIAYALISVWVGQQAYTWLPPQASAEAILIDNLFSLMVSVGTFIFLGVTGTVLFSTLFQRAAKYDYSDGPPVEGNVILEVVWTAVPFGVVVWIATYSFQIYQQMDLLGVVPPSESPAVEAVATSSASVSPIEVKAKQWAWEFYYPEQEVSSTELHLPVNQRARLVLTSEDVLHGLYIPAFRVKQDIIPGREINFEFTPIREGRYRLRDSDHSGTYSGANQTNVVVESVNDYEEWLAFAATQSLRAAENPAFEEFQKAELNPISLGWKSVKPAPAPIVNYTSSEEDSYE